MRAIKFPSTCGTDLRLNRSLKHLTTRFHATAAGVMLCCGFVFGSSSSAVLGWMKGHFGLQAGFQSLALFYLVGALVILVARTCFLKKDYEG